MYKHTPVDVLSLNCSSFMRVALVSSSSWRSFGGMKNADMLFTVIYRENTNTHTHVRKKKGNFFIKISLLSHTHCIIDDLQWLRFHMQSLICLGIQWVGLEHQAEQRFVFLHRTSRRKQRGSDAIPRDTGYLK